MGSLQFTDMQARPTAFVEVTGVTLDECPLLALPFEAAFHAHRRAWQLDETPWTARRFPCTSIAPERRQKISYSSSAPPAPFPAGSRRVQALGFLAFTLPQVAIRMPTKPPCG